VTTAAAERPLSDWLAVHKDLKRGKHVTLKLIWLEWREVHPDGLGHTQFCTRYHEWLGRQDVVLTWSGPSTRVWISSVAVQVEVAESELGLADAAQTVHHHPVTALELIAELPQLGLSAHEVLDRVRRNARSRLRWQRPGRPLPGPHGWPMLPPSTETCSRLIRRSMWLAAGGWAAPAAPTGLGPALQRCRRR
jgi:hypothetical protein